METALRAEIRYPRFGQPADVQNYIAASRRLCFGAAVLAKGSAASDLVCSLLAAQALECALKAYLSGVGFTINRLSHAPFGDDLEKLWIEAATRGLSVPARPPKWCSILNQQHGVEFPFRLSMGLPGTRLPSLLPMASDLAELVATVSKSV